MVLGDVREWATTFRTLDERLLDRIAFVWPACVAILPAQPHEDVITLNLVELLRKDSIVRRICHWVGYQSEPSGTHPNGSKFSKGKIDLRVFLDWESERYLAYECKRLNVINDSKRSSLATEYVTEGMMRFITEQYAEGLPVGCMLGYVMDGDIQFALKQLGSSVTKYKELNLIEGPIRIDPIHNVERFLTTHRRVEKTNIELRHALLSFHLE